MSEMNAGFEKLTHRKFWQSHDMCSFSFDRRSALKTRVAEKLPDHRGSRRV
jgi:hypothetical protein